MYILLNEPKFENGFEAVYNKEANAFLKRPMLAITYKYNSDTYIHQREDFNGVMFAKMFALKLARVDVVDIVEDIYYRFLDSWDYDGSPMPSKDVYLSSLNAYCDRLAKNGLALIVPKVRQSGLDAIAECFKRFDTLVNSHAPKGVATYTLGDLLKVA